MKVMLKLLMIVCIVIVSGCTSINQDGKYCNKKMRDCEVYIPLYTPMVLFVKNIINS